MSAEGCSLVSSNGTRGSGRGSMGRKIPEGGICPTKGKPFAKHCGSVVSGQRKEPQERLQKLVSSLPHGQHAFCVATNHPKAAKLWTRPANSCMTGHALLANQAEALRSMANCKSF